MTQDRSGKLSVLFVLCEEGISFLKTVFALTANKCSMIRIMNQGYLQTTKLLTIIFITIDSRVSSIPPTVLFFSVKAVLFCDFNLCRLEILVF